LLLLFFCSFATGGEALDDDFLTLEEEGDGEDLVVDEVDLEEGGEEVVVVVGADDVDVDEVETDLVVTFGECLVIPGIAAKLGGV